MTDLSPFPPGEAPECPECGEEAVDKGMASRTLMNVVTGYDDDGRYHRHDPNTTRTTVRCPNGHSWRVSSDRNPCPADGCEWPDETPELDT